MRERERDIYNIYIYIFIGKWLKHTDVFGKIFENYRNIFLSSKFWTMDGKVKGISCQTSISFYHTFTRVSKHFIYFFLSHLHFLSSFLFLSVLFTSLSSHSFVSLFLLFLSLFFSFSSVLLLSFL